jgi:hypothetical protein
MSEITKYACPQCQSDELEVAVLVWAKLLQDGSGDFETDTSEPDDSSHDWDGDSAMKCSVCAHSAPAEAFEVKVNSISCDQCQALMINGVFCHETGCVNERKTYDAENDRWYRVFKCFECGCEVEEGESCSCQDPCEEDETDEEEEETDLCECGRPANACASAEGSEYCMDRDDFLKHGVPAWMTKDDEEDA